MEHFTQESNIRQEKYIIPGDPVPLARPRWGNGHVYDSQSLLKMKASRILEELHGTKEKFIGPIHMDITFFMCLPKVGIKKMQEVNGKYHICRPDFSNLLKFCEDIAQPILYHDDCIIASICGCKRYDLTPRTELIITQLDPKLARKER
jgi:Holliday junction resolvase RusA-like endonuclease